MIKDLEKQYLVSGMGLEKLAFNVAGNGGGLQLENLNEWHWRTKYKRVLLVNLIS